MKKISKAQQELIDNAVQAASLAQDELIEAINVYNEQKDQIVATLGEVLEKYNDKLNELKGVYVDIADEARAYYEERSEKWQDGDAGTAYNEWIDQLEAIDFDEVELDLPEDIDLPDFVDLSEELAPSEPEG